MTMQKAVEDVLKPGKTLSWRVADEVLRRLEHQSESTNGGNVETSSYAGDKGDTDMLHYDVISIKESKKSLNSAVKRTISEKGMYRVFFRSNAELAPGRGQHPLSTAYRLLTDPDTAARYTVQIHISSPRNQKGPHGVEWALQNRADLRPEVITRAMPSQAGARHMQFVHIKEDGTDAFFTITAQSYRTREPHLPNDKVQPDPPGKADRKQAATGTQAQLSTELQMRFELALKKSMRRTKASIHRKFERSLKKTVRRRLKQFNGGPTAPLPGEISRMQERKRSAIEQALPKVRANVERGSGIKAGLAGVSEDEPVDGSGGGPSPPVTCNRPS